MDEYLVEFLVIEEVDDKSSGDDKPELSKDIEVRDVSLGSTTTIEYYREAGKITLSEDDIIAILQDKGCTDISVEDVSGHCKVDLHQAQWRHREERHRDGHPGLCWST